MTCNFSHVGSIYSPTALDTVADQEWVVGQERNNQYMGAYRRQYDSLDQTIRQERLEQKKTVLADYGIKHSDQKQNISKPFKTMFFIRILF